MTLTTADRSASSPGLLFFRLRSRILLDSGFVFKGRGKQAQIHLPVFRGGRVGRPWLLVHLCQEFVYLHGADLLGRLFRCCKQLASRADQRAFDDAAVAEHKLVGPNSRADFHTEYERSVFRWAADQVKHQCAESTWHAFWLVSVEGRPAAEAASELDMSVGAVYIAKSRVVARIREKALEFDNS